MSAVVSITDNGTTATINVNLKEGAATAASVPSLDNLIGGAYVPPTTGEYMPVLAPATGEVIGNVAVSGAEDVEAAVLAARAALPGWRSLTCKSRAAVMFKFQQLMVTHMDELVDLIMLEGGKNRQEAVGDVAKGNETVEWACSMPQLMPGQLLAVSRGITCHDTRDPLGIVTCIVPFNFPSMVPMWTCPIALTAGNCVILKPSEKVPLTMNRISQLLKEAGLPDGVFQIVNGSVPTVNALVDHPDVKAVTFVGSSKVAEIVAKRCRAINKRVLALGGAKNHLVALPDCDAEMCARDIVASFAGCAGQRCMAASVLLLVGDTGDLLDRVCAKAAALVAGQQNGQVGPVIDNASRDRIVSLIGASVAAGANVLVDGREWASREEGSWVGPTVLMVNSVDDPTMKVELFGPVISVLRVESWEEAIAIENASEFGNAACVYTSNGAHAEWFTSRFEAGMLGVNVGVPVPREPFSFGGMYGTASKFGDMDITGSGAMEFFTTRKKVTTKWGMPNSSAPVAASCAAAQEDASDKANFAGKM